MNKTILDNPLLIVKSESRFELFNKLKTISPFFDFNYTTASYKAQVIA